MEKPTASDIPLSQDISASSLLSNITPEQWVAIEQIVLERRAKTNPKLIDIRFVVDVVFTRFFVVLMVGKDRRDRTRNHLVSGLTKLGNTFAAVLLLLGANLVISAFILLTLYLTKSALGINLLPGHMSQQLEKWSK
jgi:hypothetical protein